jgi:hypothetical protein
LWIQNWTQTKEYFEEARSVTLKTLPMRSHFRYISAMNGKNWPLGTDEMLEFGRQSVEVQNFRKTTHMLRESDKPQTTTHLIEYSHSRNKLIPQADIT